MQTTEWNARQTLELADKLICLLAQEMGKRGFAPSLETDELAMTVLDIAARSLVTRKNRALASCETETPISLLGLPPIDAQAH
jgi:hypothetical protein